MSGSSRIGRGRNSDTNGRSDLRSEKIGNHEVFRGTLVDRSLRAVNAEAGTLDGEILVKGNFDPSYPEGQGLLTHELYHKEQSGGVAGHSIRDAEEMAARALEAMVFHEAKTTGKNMVPQSATELYEQAKEMQTKSTQDIPYNPDAPEQSFEPCPIRGFTALMNQGWTHEQLLLECVHRLISHNDTTTSNIDDQSGDVIGFLS